MASEVRVNQIQNRSGLGTITVADTGQVLSGVTTVDNLNITTGVNGVVDFTGNVGIQTNDITRTNLVGAGNSFVGLYIGDGFLAFSTSLSRPGGYYIATSVNALNAGPVTLGSTMTLHGTWVII